MINFKKNWPFKNKSISALATTRYLKSNNYHQVKMAV